MAAEVRLWEKIFILADELRDMRYAFQKEQLESFGELTISQLELIKKVKRMTASEPEGINLKSLAQEMAISTAAASEQVNSLVKKGLLDREQSSQDRRAVCIRLSEYASDVIRKVEEYFDFYTDKFLSETNSAESALMSELLDKFYNMVKTAKERC